MVELYASPTHKAVVFGYVVGSDDSDLDGPIGETVTIVATNAETGDVGSREAPNVGTFVLFYPFSFTGTDEIVVQGSEGGEDSGSVTIS